MAGEDLIIFNVSFNLLDCVFDGIIEAGLPEPCRVCVVPGEIAWDECGDGGQLEISTTSVFYSNIFPTDTSQDITVGSGGCGPGIPVASMTLSLMRCAPLPTGVTSKAPSCAALQETALLVGRDNYVIRNSLLCCLKDLKANSTIVDYRLGPVTIDGPEGGCVGNSVVLFIGLANG